MNEPRSYRRVVAYLSETPWAILPNVLVTIRDMVAFRAAGGTLDQAEIEQRIAGGKQRPDQQGGRVAVIPLWGVLVPHAGMMVDVSTPGTGLDAWLEMFRQAVADPSVEAILLDVNSPGGSADLVTEVAAEIRAARAVKPIVAVANTLAASAAYALASQASTLIASPSAMVGSVGVYTVHEDISGALAAEGVAMTLFSAPEGGFKFESNPFGPLTDDARAHLQETVNSYYRMFVNDVAQGRGVDASTVEANYGRGRALTADAALAAGMVDGIGSRDKVLERMLAGKQPLDGRSPRLQLESGDAETHLLDEASGVHIFAGQGSHSVTVPAGSMITMHSGGGGAGTTTSPSSALPMFTVVAGPIQYSKTSVVEEPWDGAAEVAKLPQDEQKLRAMHAWVDSSASVKLKGSYKFPHHKVSDPDGEAANGDEEVGAANVNGVRNALARLPGSDIPEADKQAVRAHLQHHLDDFKAQSSAAKAESTKQETNAARPGGTTTGGTTMESVITDGRPATLEELAVKTDQCKSRMAEINEQAAGRMLSGDEQSEFDELAATIEHLKATRTNIEARNKQLEAFAADEGRRVEGAGNGQGRTRAATGPGRTLPENIFDVSGYRGFASSYDELGEVLRDGAKRANEVAAYEARDRAATQAFVDELLRKDKTQEAESFAHRVLLTANPAYDAAFGRKILGKPLTAHDEQLIRAAVSNTGLGSETPIPITIDPTVILTSDGATNPLRALARTVTITGNTWRGISSDGVSVDYDAELAVVNPQTPDFHGPEVTVEKAHGEVQFSIEVDQDWGAFRGELTRMFADAKNVKEADKFLNGTGTNEPEGIVYALDALGSPYVIPTAGAGALTLADVEGIPTELPPRFDADARWLATKAFYSNIRSLAGAEGRIDVWVPLTQGFAAPNGLLQYELLGYGVAASSEMSKDFTTGGDDVAILGDFSRGFIIVDRVGMNVELDPLVRDGNGKLIGARALYVYFRNSSKLLAANAFRMLQIQ